MDWGELNFTEICRCCKRTELGMTSIFDRNAHSTYPPVKEMLRNIIPLKVQENDGLPSHVCTSCLNNIQNAYTFILQLILIDSELRQILLEREKQALLQGTFNADQCTLTESVQKAIESTPANANKNFHDNANVYHCLTTTDVEDLDEPMQYFNQHGSDDNAYEHILLKPEIKPVSEIEDIDVSENVDEPEVENEMASNLADPLYHHPDVGKESLMVQELKHLEKMEKYHHNYTVVNDKEDLLKVKKTKGMDFEDVDVDDILGTDEEYQDGKNDNQKKSQEKTGTAPKVKTKSTIKVIVQKKSKTRRNNVDEDAPIVIDDDEDIGETNSLTGVNSNDLTNNLNGVEDFNDAEEIGAKVRTMKCKLCAFTNMKISHIRRHLQTHCKDQPYSCSKCKGTFARKGYMLQHWENCDGEIHRQKGDSNQVISLTLQDLKDPVKMKEYYIVTELDVQNPPNLACALKVFKCNLCGHTSARKGNLKSHLKQHSKDSLFTCSKCNCTFAKNVEMQKHSQNCNGEISKCTRNSHQKLVMSLTLQDLEDPSKLKQYYTVTKIDVQNNDDNLKVQRADVDIEDICSKSRSKRRKTISAFRCNFCAYTSSRKYNLKPHLQTHCKDGCPFACSKCKGTFSKKDHMLSHWRICNGDINRYARDARLKAKTSKQVISLTLQDLKDPLIIKKYYTEIKIDV